jgi:hypothetical protein
MSYFHKGRSSVHDRETLRATKRTLNESAHQRIGLFLIPLPGVKTVQMLGREIIPGDKEIGMRSRNGASK